MNKHKQKILIAFLLTIFIFAVFKLVWPDKEISQQENRTLQLRPAFSLNSFLDGSFSISVEEWYADQFPFRDTLIKVDNSVKQLMSMSFSNDDITLIQGSANDLGAGQILTDINSGNEVEKTDYQTEKTTTANAETTKPSSDYSDEEKHDMNNSPTLNSEKENDANEIAETTPPDAENNAFPIIEEEVEKYSAVIIVNNAAMEIYGFNQRKADRYADLINQLHLKIPQTQIFNLLAPTAIEFYSPEKYHSLSSSQAEAINYIYSQLDSDIISVDAYRHLAEHWQEYIYFRSDHHWTALGAYYGYRAFAESADFEAIDLSKFKSGSIPGEFLGSLYRYTQSSKLTASPDQVDYYEPAAAASGKAYSDEKMQNGKEIQLINKKANKGSQYLAFIEGDHPLAHFNTSTKNGRSVFVLKESFGNSFVPYLANHYENIYVADPRSVSMNLPAFVQTNKIDDIVIINYTFAVSNEKWVAGFSRMIN